MECVVHYEGSGEFSNLVPLNEHTHNRLLEAKALRLEHGGAHRHEKQCQSVPQVFESGKHLVHMTPCYKKFTLIISRKHSLDYQAGPRTKRQKDESNQLFPKVCFSCKQTVRRIKDRRETCHPIVTKDAENKLKEKAKDLEDTELLLQIEHYDLIAKELQFHDSCYRNYVRRTIQKDVTVDSCLGNMKAVEKYLTDHVINMNQAVSMTVLHEVYNDGHTGDHRYRGKLKARIQSCFEERLLFVDVNQNCPQVVVSREGVNSNTILKCKENLVKYAATYLRDDIVSFAESLPELRWPLEIQELESRERNIPYLVTSFFETLLKSSEKHPLQDRANQLVKSYSSDIIHGVTKGTVITLKHFLVGVGLHNLTGQKIPIDILSHLGNSISYKTVCEEESAAAMVAQNLDSEHNLALLPGSGEVIITVFWADNFNMSRDTMGKSAFLNTTHAVAFQEKSDAICQRQLKPGLSRKEIQRVIKSDNSDIPKINVNKKQEPPAAFKPKIHPPSLLERSLSMEFIFIWSLLRLKASKDQVVPMLSGWMMSLRSRSQKTLQKTETTYLSPIPTPISEFTTLFKLFRKLQSLAISANMPYVNVTFDVGAALNAYKLLWFFPEGFQNIMIHLGDFHFLKENFSVIGKLVTHSGFEDIVFQASLCSSGCLNGILKGSHYNRCWNVHTVMYEALFRLLLQRFMAHTKTEIPSELDIDFSVAEKLHIEHVLKNENIMKFQNSFNDFKEDIRRGLHGKTAQFWLMYYIDLMECQHIMHTAIQENNFQMRLFAWRYMLPFFFALDKSNYARYGSFYVMTLDNIDVLYPGNRELLNVCGLSVQGQDKFPLRTAIDQRGEQTINRDAKVSGGIKLLNPDDNSLLKWSLNRSHQAKNTEALKSYANINPAQTIYKQSRPSQVLLSEKNVSKVMEVLTEEYLNPFNADLNPEYLYMLSSGSPLDQPISESILKIKTKGKEAHESFYNNRLASKKENFQSPIKRHSEKLFCQSTKKVKVTVGGKTKTVEANRDILGHLLSISKSSGRAIDFRKALEHPLSPVPLSLAFPDGTMRKTQKQVLLEIIQQFDDTPDVQLPPPSKVAAYVVDLMAVIRVYGTFSLDTYEDLIMTIISRLPKNYKRIDLVCDTYVYPMLKSNEHLRRGSSGVIAVKSEFSKLPRDFGEFLKCAENKTRLIELFGCVLKKRKNEILDRLNSDSVLFSSFNECLKLTRDEVSIIESLCSNQPEADTKVFLHAQHALQEEGFVIIRSHSGDTDIIVLGLSSNLNTEKLYIDTNKGASRKVIHLSDIDMSEQQKKALLGFHALTGNDYNSAFFRKGKKKCWKALNKRDKYVKAMCKLGESWEVSEELLSLIEQYVCDLYSQKCKNVNAARYTMVDDQLGGNKVMDMSLLPPCLHNLNYHVLRTNCIARIWRLMLERTVVDIDFKQHGWDEHMKPKWYDKLFPSEIEEILVKEEWIDFSDSDDDSSCED